MIADGPNYLSNSHFHERDILKKYNRKRISKNSEKRGVYYRYYCKDQTNKFVSLSWFFQTNKPWLAVSVSNAIVTICAADNNKEDIIGEA